MHGNKRIIKDIMDNLVVFLAAVVLFVGTIALLCLFGGGIMQFFGFTCSSPKGVILFFVEGAVVSWPVSLAAEAIPKVLCYDKKVINKWQAFLMYVALATFATSFGLSVVGARMKSVVANKTSILVVSLLLAMCNSRLNIIQRPEDT